jgi:hypothetical protein
VIERYREGERGERESGRVIDTERRPVRHKEIMLVTTREQR